MRHKNGTIVNKIGEGSSDEGSKSLGHDVGDKSNGSHLLHGEEHERDGGVDMPSRNPGRDSNSEGNGQPDSHNDTEEFVQLGIGEDVLGHETVDKQLKIAACLTISLCPLMLILFQCILV